MRPRKFSLARKACGKRFVSQYHSRLFPVISLIPTFSGYLNAVHGFLAFVFIPFRARRRLEH